MPVQVPEYVLTLLCSLPHTSERIFHYDAGWVS
jgi:hypothetical protein